MRRNLLLLAVSTVGALLIVEAGLRIWTRFPVTRTSNKVAHERLLYTLNPALSDVNRDGFRNPGKYRGEEIIAIGDSHTYGFKVPRSASWPGRLEDLLGRDVYNMGVPSYHLYQYVLLIERMSKRRPRDILVGLHPGNDLSAYVCRTLALDYWTARFKRSPSLTNEACPGTPGPHPARSDRTRWQHFKRLVRHTAVGSLLDRALWDPYLLPFLLDVGGLLSDRGDGTPTQGASSTDARPERFRVDTPEISWGISLKAFRGRRRHVHPLREKVRETVRNGKVLLRRAVEKSRRRGVSIKFLIFPSRSYVIYRWARSRGHPLPEVARRTGEFEDRLIRGTETFLKDLGVRYVNVTPGMVRLFDRSLREADPLYPTWNEHPDERGYRLYARYAASLVRGDPGSSDPDEPRD